ncbi:MAG: hypothetical protein JNL57_12215 [Bacteroidetes bacterium]|nr:hypothetical protein [Bacteroidota bacterium]
MLKLQKYGLSVFLPLVLLISIPRTWTHHCHSDYPHSPKAAETRLSEDCSVCDTDLWLCNSPIPALPAAITRIFSILHEVELKQPELHLSNRLPNKSPPII